MMNVPARTTVTGGIPVALLAIALLAVAALVSPPVAAQSQATTLTVLVPAEFPDIDPCETVSGDQQMLLYHVFSRPYTFNERMEPQPDLVVADSVSEDGTLWTFDLRSDAMFHDGTPVDAAAVKYSIDRMRTGGCGQASLYAPIADVRVESPTRFVIETNGLFPALRNNLAHPAAAIVSPTADAELGAEFGQRPVGSGPYRLERWATGERIVLAASGDYYGPRPFFERIDFQFVDDPTTRALLLETGQADVALRTSALDTPRLVSNPELVVDQVLGRSMFYMLNVTKAPFDDVRVRRAINHAVDRDALIERVLFGTGTPAVSLIEAVQGTIVAGEYAYDPDLARSLLEDAGAVDARVVLLAPNGRYPFDTEVAQATTGFLRDVGLDVDLQVVSDWPSYVATVEDQEFDLFLIGFGGSTGDPDNAYRRTLHGSRAGQLWNPGAYVNDEVDALIDAGAREFDQQRRDEIYAEMQRLAWADAPWLFMYRDSTFLARRAEIEGVPILPGTEVPIFWMAHRR
jgi:peptide/nickel transport system substrate-binding protein